MGGGAPRAGKRAARRGDSPSAAISMAKGLQARARSDPHTKRSSGRLAARAAACARARVRPVRAPSKLGNSASWGQGMEPCAIATRAGCGGTSYTVREGCGWS